MMDADLASSAWTGTTLRAVQVVCILFVLLYINALCCAVLYCITM